MEIFNQHRDRITIAILALGGEGGGVLADWIQVVARQNGYVAQGTSVPGVAQRTGSTVYYIELVRIGAAGGNRPDPVLAMMPVRGDVDIVIASELMEAGRAILRGFVSKDRTTLIGSTHRVYAISEKSALGDGTGANARILDAAERRAARFIGFDMAEAAQSAGSVISSVMFGAMAGSGSLPFPREAFEDAVRHGGKAVAANLKGFASGFDAAGRALPAPAEAAGPRAPTTAAGRALHDRLCRSLPEEAHALATDGVARLMEWQDARYAEVYVDRVEELAAIAPALAAPAARHLALWMAYEDPIRVADLKIRATRSAHIAREVRVGSGQLLRVTEYMHPRLQEVCETLPRRIGSRILASEGWRRRLEPFFARGRHVETTGLRWFIVLRLLAAMRPFRRGSLRYAMEQERIGRWLDLVRDVARSDVDAAVEILGCQALVKGYSDTFERGIANLETILAAVESHVIGTPDAAARIAALRDAALQDEEGKALGCAVSQLSPVRQAS
ncbi:indolepyruvate oxidoreductase subunit beta family protein [Novosphingobium taihuense]|uniref:Indolepyruvate ferredoxin oxidoreductase beta subunit n=1 Tax=Novosphingobium taihuense TaxID=260085 RepID=A0A7W7ETL3_9SPHN|nr:indolepyruvate oxidoreductase subunit beta family protein [Novosphingobium taihuense]MBB4613367.1 indolepyruvate ferredoxin oxidoreductase beta subunit [Novosphingobium taihuense]TWH85507.1 indolepyruvate ferredoxin oxidoreductase beta subunit [Novosphingobium taihuense]